MRQELKALNLPQASAARKKFGEKVLTARKALGLVRREVAERTGVSEQQIHHIESGNHFPSMAVAIVLCRELKLDVDLKKL